MRRSAFRAWGEIDSTQYVHDNLGLKDEKHAGFDDVRSVLTAVIERRELADTRRWLGASLSSARISNKSEIAHMVERGLEEIGALLLS